MDDEDFMRPPESSEDESQAVHKGHDAPDGADARPSLLMKRKRTEAAGPPRQSKRTKGRLRDTKDDLPPAAAEAPPPALASPFETDFLDLMTSKSQSQKQKLKIYASRAKNDFKTYNRVADPVDAAEAPKSLEVKKTLIEEKEHDPKPVFQLEKTAPTQEPEAKPLFRTFSDYGMAPVHSSASTATSDAQVMDLRSSPTAGRLHRSRSVSSLTSLSSDEGEDGAKSRLVFKTFEDSLTDTCPVCRTPIDRSLLPNVGKGLRSLSLQRQQEICHQHKLSEAQSFCRERGFPNVEWGEVERTSIPNLIKHLRQVLQRKATSFYLDQLDRQVIASKGKPKALRNYLHTGVLDIAKPGYYGPKGETVMAHVITQTLAEDLRKVSKTDKAVSSAGVGPYVAAVLVPECTMRLVMQDMKMKSQERARNILEESTDIGRLLNPDDDHVEIFDHAS